MEDKRKELPNGTFIVGNKLMAICNKCGKLIRVDKPFLGSLHICVLDDKGE